MTDQDEGDKIVWRATCILDAIAHYEDKRAFTKILTAGMSRAENEGLEDAARMADGVAAEFEGEGKVVAEAIARAIRSRMASRRRSDA